jgi:hypothetical protein
MAEEIKQEAIEAQPRLGSCLLWFFWGISLGFTTILSLVLLVLLMASASLNLYLLWQMSGLEVSVSRRADTAPAIIPQQVPIIPTDALAAIPTNTPLPPPLPPSPTHTPTPASVDTSLNAQLATISAIATEIASQQSNGAPAVIITPTPNPNAVPTAVAIGAPASSSAEGSSNETVSSTDGASTTGENSQVEAAQAFEPPQTSSNKYSLIPIDGERDQRPGEEHGDLNLKLRGWEAINVDQSLVELEGSGIDPDAPTFKNILEPNIIATYTVHNWDWGCNCPGELLTNEGIVLIGIKTTPGEPIFIPKKDQDIFGGNYYAMVLYASEDSLTFVYSRSPNVVKGYTVHYQGLHVDPNLLKLYGESKGNELPGLTLDTPVGVASDELIVAIRDNGKFLDARSLRDWWD